MQDLSRLAGQPLPPAWLPLFQRFPVQDITSGIMMAALDTRQRFHLSYRDAAIIEASRAMGCMQVLSEDLNDGQDYSGVRVANPFR